MCHLADGSHHTGSQSLPSRSPQHIHAIPLFVIGSFRHTLSYQMPLTWLCLVLFCAVKQSCSSLMLLKQEMCAQPLQGLSHVTVSDRRTGWRVQLLVAFLYAWLSDFRTRWRAWAWGCTVCFGKVDPSVSLCSTLRDVSKGYITVGICFTNVLQQLGNPWVYQPKQHKH